MRRKKGFVLFISICIIAAMTIGCGKGEEGTGSKTTGEGGNNQENDTASTIKKEGFPIVDEPIVFKVFGQQGPVQEAWSGMDVFTEYEKMTHVKLDFTNVLPAEGFNEKKSLMFASNDYPDIFLRANLTNTEIVKYGDLGVLAPLEDLIEEYAPNFKKHLNDYPAILSRIMAPDGHIYALPDVISLTAARDDKFWINKEWLKKVNKKVPTTVDELEEVLRAFKSADLNGNGQKDEIPMGAADAQSLIKFFAGIWGHQFQFNQYLEVNDGKVSTYVVDDSFKEELMWLNNMYEEGLIDPEIFTQEYAKYAAKMAGQNMGLFFNQADDTFDSKNFEGIAPFKGKSEKQYVACAPVARGNGVYAIGADCTNKEAAMRWVDYFYGKEGSIFLRFGVEGKTWNYDDKGLPQYVDGILNSPEGSGTAIGKFTIWPGGGAPQWLNEENSIAVASQSTKNAQIALEPYLPEEIYAEPLLSQEVNDRLSILQNDINTYMKEATAKFIKGELSFDKWDNYKSTLEKIGLEEWVAIYQDSLDSLK